jgi:Fe-S-cluster containining protein
MGTIAFACQPGCTNCCEVEGNIYITEEDLVRIAEFLGMTPAAFEAQYVYRTRNLLRFRKPKQGCPFLDRGCRIHPVKPVQCRLYPFWPEIVERQASWRREMKTCPGIGKGELIQIAAAVEIAQEMKRAYPSTYR